MAGVPVGLLETKSLAEAVCAREACIQLQFIGWCLPLGVWKIHWWRAGDGVAHGLPEDQGGVRQLGRHGRRWRQQRPLQGAAGAVHQAAGGAEVSAGAPVLGSHSWAAPRGSVSLLATEPLETVWCCRHGGGSDSGCLHRVLCHTLSLASSVTWSIIRKGLCLARLPRAACGQPAGICALMAPVPHLFLGSSVADLCSAICCSERLCRCCAVHGMLQVCALTPCGCVEPQCAKLTQKQGNRQMFWGSLLLQRPGSRCIRGELQAQDHGVAQDLLHTT